MKKVRRLLYQGRSGRSRFLAELPKEKKWLRTIAKIVQELRYERVNPFLTDTPADIRGDLQRFVDCDDFWQSLEALNSSIRGIIRLDDSKSKKKKGDK